MVRLGEAWWYLVIFGDWVYQITPQVMAEVLPTVNGKLLMAAALERWTLWNLNAIAITGKNRRTWHDMWIYIYIYINIYIYDDSDHYHPHHEKNDHQISLNHPNISKYHQWQNVLCLFKPQPGLGRWRLSVPLGRGSCECGHQGAAVWIDWFSTRKTWNQRRVVVVDVPTIGWCSYGYGSIPINTIFRGMNIHLPAILMFTRGTRFWHTAIYV